jgi:cyclic 2,3-diphosphoglycerate synthase
MGRGGPAEPETIVVPPTVEALLELSRGGRHAASDHLETAALAGVATVGCRRCGGGLAGGVVSSNMAAAARTAVELAPDVVVFDGSGAALPPVATDRTVVVVGGHQDPAVAAGYLNGYRLLAADLVVLTMAEPGSDWERTRDAVCAVVREGVAVVATVLRPRPASDVGGRSVAYFCTAPTPAHAALAAHLRDAHGAVVTHVSGNLANRTALHEELARIEADVFLIELKAAAVDVVAEFASAREADIVLASNDVVPLAAEGALDDMLLEMAGIEA